MTVLDPQVDSSPPATTVDAEALIKEARRLRRRRRIIGSLIAALAAGAGVAGYLTASGPPSRSHLRPANHASTPGSASVSAETGGPTRSPDLIQPTTLATLPDGDLLILDSSRDQILELTPDGALSVFAGDGRLGFTGDGGPARDAELDLRYFSSAGMAVTANGSVDVLDDGNCRIRQITPGGMIRTIFRMPLVRVHPSGTACGMTSVAASPAGRLYVATETTIERLSRSGHLTWVAGSHGFESHQPAHLTPSTVVFTPASIAFNAAGDLDIASLGPKAVYRLTPTGELTDLGASYPTQLSADPDGSVLVGTHFGVIQAATASGLRLVDDVDPRHVSGIRWGRDGGFQENGLTVTPTGTTYVDNAQGNGYGAATVLVRIDADKHAVLVPIRTPLAATLPKADAAGFPAALYPPARPSRGRALASCPSNQGLERFTPRGTAEATQLARTYHSSRFASDIAVTDRSWWTAEFNDYASGALGTHRVTGETLTAQSPFAAALRAACGSQLVDDSVAVTLRPSEYSNFAGTVYLLDRDGHPLVYDVR